MAGRGRAEPGGGGGGGVKAGSPRKKISFEALKTKTKKNVPMTTKLQGEGVRP